MESDGSSRLSCLQVERLRLASDRFEQQENEPSTSAYVNPVYRESSANPEIPGNGCNIHDLPLDPILKILKFLSLRERIKLSKTCRRFHEITLDKSTSAAPLVVLNIFQKKIWDENVRGNTVSSLDLYNITGQDNLRAFLAHISKIDCVKIWFERGLFVRKCLEIFSSSEVKVRNVDVYPYANEIPLDCVNEVFPSLNALTMRPHGSNMFFSGIKLNSMPAFDKLNVLLMDSFSPQGEFKFPANLKSLDFAHRDLPRNLEFLACLKPLNLRYLSCSHIKFDKHPCDIAHFISNIRHMTNLEVLQFKFCHINTDFDSQWGNDVRYTKMNIRNIIFDLCYDVTYEVMRTFISFTQMSLKTVTSSILYEDMRQFNNIICLSSTLFDYNMALSFSVMQKETQQKEPITPPPAIPEEFRGVLTRFEASYLIKSDLLKSVFSKTCKNLQEIKFIAARGLTDKVLSLIAKNCPYLKELTIINCERATDEGLLAFSKYIESRRTSTPLNILYKNNGAIVRVYGELLKDYTSKREFVVNYMTKTFPQQGGYIGERLHFKNEKTNKTVVFKNYTSEDSRTLVGLIVDVEEDLQRK